MIDSGNQTPQQRRQGFIPFLIPALILSAVALGVGSVSHLIRSVEFMWGPMLAGIVCVGLSSAFLVALYTGNQWIENTPVYRQWRFLLGSVIVKPVLFVLMLLLFAAGWAAVLVPSILGKQNMQFAQPHSPPEEMLRMMEAGLRPGGMKPKSFDINPSSPAYFDAVMEDLESSLAPMRRAAVRSIIKALTNASTLRHNELHAALINKFKTGPIELQRDICDQFVSYGTPDDIPVIEEVIQNTTDQQLKSSGEAAIRLIKFKNNQ